jgi:ribosomal-protein-alanine N-acetyltransferase
MPTRPTIHTARLRLRPFTLADAQAVQKFSDDRAIAASIHHIRYPYQDQDRVGEQWIATPRMTRVRR